MNKITKEVIIIIILLIVQVSIGEEISTLWTGTYNGSANGDDIGFGIAVDNQGNVYVNGWETVTNQGTNILVKKYDTNGTEIWARTYNGLANGNDYGSGIAVDSSRNVYIAGWETVSSQGFNIWVRKYNTNGTEIWTRTYNGLANGDDRGVGIAVDSLSNVYVSGWEFVTGQGGNIWVRKYDTNGNEIWTKTYNGSANSTDYGYGIAVDSLGNVYVSGSETVTGQGKNIWVRKYDTNGNELWTETYNGSANIDDEGYKIAVDSSGNIYVTGYETVTGQGWNMWVRKYGIIHTTKGGGDFKVIIDKKGYTSPNKGELVNFVYKTTSSGTITFKIFNLAGELIKSFSVTTVGGQQENTNWDCRNEKGEILSSGIYIVKTEGPGLNLTKN